MALLGHPAMSDLSPQSGQSGHWSDRRHQSRFHALSRTVLNVPPWKYVHPQIMEQYIGGYIAQTAIREDVHCWSSSAGQSAGPDQGPGVPQCRGLPLRRLTHPRLGASPVTAAGGLFVPQVSKPIAN